MTVASTSFAQKSYMAPSLNPVKIEDSSDGKPLDIVKDNRTNAIIVFSDNDKVFNNITYVPCGKGELYKKGVNEIAALELQKHIQLATGVKIPIVCDKGNIPDNKILILVGQGKTAQKHGLNNQDLQPEGFVVKNFGKGVAIIGAPAGKEGYDGLYSTLFGVYDFLERFVGIRWYYPGKDGMIIPFLKTLTIPPVQYCDYPKYIKRQMIPWNGQDFPGEAKPDYTIHALRYRAGGSGPLGSIPTYNHTPWDLTKYFIDFPQGFAIDANGKKISVPANPPMPCYGNPETLNFLLKGYEDFYKKKLMIWKNNKRTWGVPTKQVLPFSPPDHPVNCSCNYCQKLMDYKKPFHAQASQLMGNFVGKLSWALKKKYPEKILFYLPYYNYVAPPENIKFADNLFIQVCLMYGNSLYNEENKNIRNYYREWIDEWKRLSGKKVHIYAYPCWPGLLKSPMPYQYPHNLKKFTADFKDQVNGAFLCGPGNGGHPGIEGGVWAYQMPTVYCWFRLMWNPDFNVDAALEEQTRLLYGPAAEPMGKILKLLTDKWENQNIAEFKNGMNIGPYHAGQISKEEVYTKIMVDSDIQFLKKELNKASKLAGKNNPYQRRVDFFGKTVRLMIKDYENFTSNEIKKNLSMKVIKTSKLPVIDGHLNEVFWEKTEKHFFVRANLAHESTPKVNTILQCAYYQGRDGGQDGIIIGLKMSEPDMNSVVVKEKKEIYSGNCVEIFLEYLPDSVYQLIIDSEGKRSDYFHGKKPKNRKSCPKLKVQKNSDNWTVELFIPLASLDAELEFKKITGMKANFTRYRVTKDSRSRSRWSTNYGRSNLDKSAFGNLKFIPQKASVENQ
jgi:hypothetical protein